MGFRSYVKNTVKGNSNVKGWSSWDAIRGNAKTIRGFVADLKPADQDAPPAQGSFEQMVKQQELTEADLRSRMKSNLLVTVFCALLSLFAMGWMIFLLMKSMFLSALVAFSLGALMFAYAFQSYFFYFQIKQRRLNCTLTECFSGIFSKKK